ncbi:MAG: LysE family transporter [Archaeoglobaceae archaeon]
MLEFFAKVVAISSSGALAPGPLSAATATIGVQKGWKGGFMVSLGHFVVEAPIVFLIAFFVSLATIDALMKPLAILGGGMLILFGYLTIKSALSKERSKVKTNFNPFLTGVLLTALNPFFIAWWFSVGSMLVVDSTILFGSLGAVLLLASHVWIDFAWLSLIAYLTSLKGIMEKFHRAILFLLGLLVLFFGLDYLHFAFLNTHLI